MKGFVSWENDCSPHYQEVQYLVRKKSLLAAFFEGISISALFSIGFLFSFAIPVLFQEAATPASAQKTLQITVKALPIAMVKLSPREPVLLDSSKNNEPQGVQEHFVLSSDHLQLPVPESFRPLINAKNLTALIHEYPEMRMSWLEELAEASQHAGVLDPNKIEVEVRLNTQRVSTQIFGMLHPQEEKVKLTFSSRVQPEVLDQLKKWSGLESDLTLDERASSATRASFSEDQASSGLSLNDFKWPEFFDGFGRPALIKGGQWISYSAETLEGWLRLDFKNEGTLPTLYQVSKDESVLSFRNIKSAPLTLDQESLRALLASRGLSLAAGTAILYGRVQPGLDLSLQIRSEGVFYHKIKDENYFFIVNVEPGIAPIQVTQRQARGESVESQIVVPALEGCATYLDVPELKKVELSLELKAAKEDQNSKEIILANLKIARSFGPGILAITNKNGSAALKGFWHVPGQDLYLDVSSKSAAGEGAVYRYKIDWREVLGHRSITLTQYSPQRIRSWMEQSEASDMSGLMVAHYSAKKINAFIEDYQPKVNILQATGGHIPRVYTVLWNNQLSSTDPIEGDIPRALAANLPGGLVQFSLIRKETDGDEEMRRVDLFATSIGRVHIIK